MPNEKKVKPMPGHEFEKKVQQQMEGLNVTPSNLVWNRVEAQIRREKRRRRILIALPLLLLMLGGGAYWALQLNQAPAVITTEKNKENDTKNSNSDPAVVAVPEAGNPGQDIRRPDNIKEEKSGTPLQEQPSSSEPAIAVEKTTNNALPEVKDNRIAGNKATASPDRPAPRPAVSQPSRDITQTDKRKQAARPSSTIAGAERKNLSKKKDIVSKDNDRDVADSKATDLVQEKNTRTDAVIVEKPAPVVIDSSAATASNKPETDVAEKSTDVVAKKEIVASPDTLAGQTVAAKPKKTSKEQKWHFGIMAGAGISQVSHGGPFSGLQSSRLLDAGLYSGNFATPGQAMGLPPTAAAILPGFNWYAGAFAERKITKRLSISAGVQYNYFSTHSEIGKRVDSSRYINNSASSSLRVDAYYRDGQSNRYTSEYHFVELPVSLRLHVAGKKNVGLYWSAGASIGQLFSTTGLHFDGQSGLYYKDNSLFQRTQWSIHSGLGLRLFAKSKNPLEIGPQFNYQTTNLLKQKNAEAQHLLGWGLMMRWYIK
jgi:hypothetical protein